MFVRKTIPKCIFIGDMLLFRCNFKRYAEDHQCRGDGVGLEFGGSVEAKMRIKWSKYLIEINEVSEHEV